MRSSVRVAMKTSSAITRKARKDEELTESERQKQHKASKDESLIRSKRVKTLPEAEQTTSSAAAERKNPSREDRPKEFPSVSTSAPRRLNDIAQAPPEFKKLPRGATKEKVQKPGENKTLQQGVLSMAQKLMLEEERERAVRLYREMKKRKSSIES